MQLTVPMGMKGRFTVELIDAKSGHVERRLEFDNVITDVGLASLATATPSEAVLYVGVGTGSTPPSTSDTELDAGVGDGSYGTLASNAAIADVIGYVAGSPDYVRLLRTRTFFENQGNGALTEIGMFGYAGNGGVGALFARQLLIDADGDPTTIVKTNVQQLRVSYELRIYPPQADITGTFTLDGEDYDYTMRAGNFAGGWTSLYGTFTGGAGQVILEDNTPIARGDGFSNSGGASPDSQVHTLVPGLNAIDTVGKYEPGSNASNFVTGIGAANVLVVNSNNGTFGMRAWWSPKFFKTNLQRLVFTTRSSWGRAS
jgi:hypothetical protein